MLKHVWSPCVSRLGCTKFQSLHGWLIFPSWPPFVWHWPPSHPLPSTPSNSCQSSAFNPPAPPHLHLRRNKCKSLTWSLVGPWSDPRVIFSRGQGLKWQARFGGRCWGLERAKGGLNRPYSFPQALSRSATPVICISLLTAASPISSGRVSRHMWRSWMWLGVKCFGKDAVASVQMWVKHVQ